MENYENMSLEDLPNEEWIDCIGFDGIYAVSNLGRVKGLERWRETRPGIGYMMKEKIRKQSMTEKYSSIRIFLCLNGIVKPFSTSRIVFFSFNYNVENLPEYFVMHKDGNWKNNNLDNLKIATQNEISQLTFDMGKVEHLKLGNPIPSKYTRETGVMINGVVSKKKCTKCNKTKDVNEFRDGRNECFECNTKEYYKRNNSERKKGWKIKVVDLVTNEVSIYKNFNDPNLLKFITVPTAMKYEKSGEIYKPYRNSKFKNVNPLRIKRVYLEE